MVSSNYCKYYKQKTYKTENIRRNLPNYFLVENINATALLFVYGYLNVKKSILLVSKK